MRKELDYFKIENSLGWNQNWFTDYSMYDGGCAAVTACDLCIILAQQKALSTLYPYNPNHLTRKDYLSFSEIMKPYLRPRWQGIDTLELYIDGLSAYLHDIHVDVVRVTGLHGTAKWQYARSVIREQMDSSILVPFLLLYHKSPSLKDFQWHWFNLAGYEEFDGEFYVKAITYGTFHWLNLQELWDTGHRSKGGLIRLSLERRNYL